MTIYNNTTSIKSIRLKTTQKRVVLLPGANPNVKDAEWKEMKDALKGHIEKGYISQKQVKKETNASKDAGDGAAVSEKDLLKIVEETFDVDALNQIAKETKSKKVKAAVKAQIKEINKK